MEDCDSTQYSLEGSKLEYKLNGAMPEYSTRPYFSISNQKYSTKYYRGN
ncbi:hypothetical protein HY212_05185 [Candidatus Pacearchaeota archaeon]|nr:hypothetical protein [Candidatus Pacearchaeota archaeon]